MFPAASAKRAEHPAAFPQERPNRLIQLYTDTGDVVLDPFMGSGTTALAAISAQRQWVDYETSEHYVAVCKKKLNADGASKASRV